MKYRKLVKQLNNLQLFRIFMERRNKTVRIKTKKKAFVSVLLSFVMIMGLFFVPKVNAEEQPNQPNTISFKQVEKDMDMVDGIILRVDGNDQETPISYPAGLITDNLSSLDKHLNETQKFQKAVVRDSITHTETPISRIGTYAETTYYSLNDQQDIGIALTANQKVVLICASEYNVTYDYDEELGTVTGPDTISNGEDLNISIQANDTYHISSVLFNNKPESINENQKTASLKIESSRISNEVIITVQFEEDTDYQIIEKGAYISGNTYIVETDGIQQGSLCLNDDSEIIPNVEPGNSQTFWLYSDSNTGGSEWVLNMLRINDEDINVPYGTVPNTTESQSDTRLSNGSIVTIKLIYDDLSISWKNDANHIPKRIRSIYEITITNIRENITIEGNFKQKNNREIILTGLKGINKVGAASENAQSGLWQGNTFYKPGHHYYYGLQSNDKDTVYTVYYKQKASGVAGNPGEAFNIYLFSVKQGYNPYTVDIDVSFNGIPKQLQDIINTRLQSNGGLWMTTEELVRAIKNEQSDYRHFEYKTDIFSPIKYNWLDEVENVGYTHAFVIREDNSEEAKNQIAKLTAHPYEYNLVFNLNEGEAEFGNNYTLNNDETYTFNETYTLENGAVDAYMPTVKPTKDGSVFLGWKLYKGGTPVSETLYSPNEAFTIDETSINYSEGDVTSNTGHTFTFVAQWEDVATSAETAALFVEAYKEVPNSQDGAIEYNDRYYVLDSEILNDYGTVGNPSILIRYTNPDPNSYSLNSEQSKFYIEKVQNENASNTWKENNTFKVYYDFIDYDLTVKKDAVGEYADLTREWNIQVTLKDQNDTPISNTTFSDNVITNADGQVTLQLHDDEEFKFENLNINTQYSITELDTSNDYNVTYQIGTNTPTNTSISNESLKSDTTVTVINTMKDINIPDTNIPTSGMNNTITMLAIGSLGIIGIVTLLWYWRKKHV